MDTVSMLLDDWSFDEEWLTAIMGRMPIKLDLDDMEITLRHTYVYNGYLTP